MRLLRDRSRLTRLLLLRELALRPDAPLRELAGLLGVTVQAVSTYVRGLADEGLLADEGRRRTVTPEGVQVLLEGFRELKRTVDEAYEPLAVIKVTSAVAGSRVRAGERVGLFMEAGELVARAGAESASTGRAVDDAEEGDEVRIHDLQGVVALSPGKLWLVRLPGPEEGGSRAVSLRKLRALLEQRHVQAERVGVEGAGAKVLARKSGWPVHFEFAAPRAAFHASELGLETVLFVSRDRLKEVLAALDDLNESTLHRVPVEILEAPLEAAPKRGRKP